eukprot:15085039-Alexandrium_andersonii.AAC.1
MSPCTSKPTDPSLPSDHHCKPHWLEHPQGRRTLLSKFATLPEYLPGRSRSQLAKRAKRPPPPPQL